MGSDEAVDIEIDVKIIRPNVVGFMPRRLDAALRDKLLDISARMRRWPGQAV